MIIYNKYIDGLLKHPYRFAVTMRENPHYYTLREDWDNQLFTDTVKFIRDNCQIDVFKGARYKCFYANGFKYWSMGYSAEVTILINCAKAAYKCDFYDKIAYMYDSSFNDKRRAAESRIVFKTIELKGNVLDVGCGTGLVMDYNYHKLHEYWGLDISEGMLEAFKNKHFRVDKSRLINCSMKDFYCDNKFDTIVCLFGSANYLEREELDKILKLLTDEGSAYIMFFRDYYKPEIYAKAGFDVNTAGLNYYPVPDSAGVAIGNYVLVKLTKDSRYEDVFEG